MASKKTKQNDVTRAVAGGEASHARPEQYTEGFQTGYDQARDTPEELLGPNFARGTAAENVPGPQRAGRFSEGAETEGDTPEKLAEGRFSDAVEKKPS